MKQIVVYQSSTGFTAQYAKWLGEMLNCPVKSLKEVSQAELSNYEQVIFGGWIMGDAISGLSKLKEMNLSHLVVFAVGSTPIEIVDLDLLKETNQLDNVYYLVGGFRFKELNFAVRTILKILKKSVSKKTDKTLQEQFMADNLGSSFDHSDKAYLKPLLADLKDNDSCRN